MNEHLNDWLKDMDLSMISEDEARKLIAVLKETQPDCSESDIKTVFNWALKTKIAHGALENILDGSFAVFVKNGVVTFRLSENGERKAVELIQKSKLQ